MAEIPIFRFVLPLVLGIGLSYYVKVPIDQTLVMCSFLSLLFLYILLFKWRIQKRRLLVNQLSASLIFIMFFLAGVLLMDCAEYSTNDKLIEQGYKLKVVEKNQRTNHVSIEAKVMWTENKIGLEGKKILLHLKKDCELEIGDVLFASLELKPFESEIIPYLFNTKEYYSSKSVFYSGWYNDPIIKLESTQGARAVFSSLRTKLSENLRKYFKEQDLSLLQAMVLGDRANLSEDLKEQFIQTGSMHMLAVSGMHVGAIYLVLNYLLGCIAKYKKLVLLITLTGVWSYALLSGFGPPVQRASFMVSLMAFAPIIGRDSNSLNTLFVCVFVILLIDPLMYLSTSFRFSFTAVLSILMFYPVIQKQLKPKTLLLRWSWQLLCLGVSAQILILPLSLYYFQKFSLVFPISGLLVVPLLMLVFYGGLIFLGLSNFTFDVIQRLAELLHDLIGFTLWLNDGIAQIPFAIYQNMNFGVMEILVYYLLLFAIVRLVLYWHRAEVLAMFVITPIIIFSSLAGPMLKIIKIEGGSLLLIGPKRVYQIQNDENGLTHSFKEARIMNKFYGFKEKIIIELNDQKGFRDNKDLILFGNDLILWNNIIIKQYRYCENDKKHVKVESEMEELNIKSGLKFYKMKKKGRCDFQNLSVAEVYKCQDYVIEM